MAMFPPSIPHVFIRWLTRPGDTVYDPFCGRGTTLLEAALLSRVGYGSDANPLAWILSAAKADPPTRRALDQRLADLQARVEIWDSSGAPPHIRMLFSTRTLGELLWLRTVLNVRRRADRFIMATLLGIVHANADSAGRPRGLTVSMPNTFSMAPGYVARFIKSRSLRPPDVGVISRLKDRIARLPLPDASFVRGKAWLQDARHRLNGPIRTSRAKLVFTSPPYLQVIKYGKFNWIRLWLLGRQPAEVDLALFASSSVTRYLQFMTDVVTRLRAAVRNDGYICLVIGDVRRDADEINLARAVADACVPRTDLRLLGIVTDAIPIERKVSRIWKDNRGRATKTDRIVILGGPDAQDPAPPELIRWTDS